MFYERSHIPDICQSREAWSAYSTRSSSENFLISLSFFSPMEGHEVQVGQPADQEKEEEKPSIYPSQKQVIHLKTVQPERGEKI